MDTERDRSARGTRRAQARPEHTDRTPIALREPSSAAAPGDAPLPITAPTTRCAHDGWVQAAALTRDAGLAATGDSNGEVRIWAPRSHTPARAAYAHGSWVLAIAFAPRGDVVVSAGADGGIVRYDLATGERAWLGTHEGSVRAIAFAPDGRSFATGGSDGTVRITSVGGAPLAVCDHGEPVRAVGFSPCGTKLATAGAAGVTRLWDPATGAPVGKFEPPAASVQALAFSRDGTLCTTAHRDGSLTVWDADRATLLGRVEPDDPGPPAWCVTLGPYAQRFATGGADGVAAVRDAYGRTVARVRHGAPIRTGAFSANGTTLVTGGNDGSALLWSLPPRRSPG